MVKMTNKCPCGEWPQVLHDPKAGTWNIICLECGNSVFSKELKESAERWNCGDFDRRKI